MGDMAVSNSIGSNVFDILVGLGLPWALKTLAINYGSDVSSTLLSVLSIFLFSFSFKMHSISINPKKILRQTYFNREQVYKKWMLDISVMIQPVDGLFFETRSFIYQSMSTTCAKYVCRELSLQTGRIGIYKKCTHNFTQ